jgi:hypothetical protein
MFPGRFRGRFVSARQDLHKFLSEWSHRSAIPHRSLEKWSK